MLKKSYLAAVRIGLMQYLKQETGIQWDYYNSLVLPDEGAKGAIFVANTRNPGGINYTRTTHEIQLQLLLSHLDHQEAQGMLCDWGEYLIEVMLKIKDKGIYGLYRDVQLNGACYGIKLSDTLRYFVQDADQRQDVPEGIALGTLQANYEFIHESGVQLNEY